tara:strand:+ start:48571 stop:49815 length:1245 start_codon:yes stop_codon:yes gene_type:complete
MVSGSAPAASDELYFNTTPANAVGGTVIVDTNLNLESITFTTTEKTVLTHGADKQTISLGAGGITLEAGSGAVNIGQSSAQQLIVNVDASQTWTNNSDKALTVRYIATGSSAGGKTLTFSANGTGSISTPFKITDNGSAPISIVVDSAGTGSVNLNSATGSSAYRGGTTIIRGKLQTTSTLGNGDVTLGDTSGTYDATLSVKSSTFATDINVRAGSSGTKSLLNIYTAGTSSYTGNMVLDDDLFLSTSRDMSLSGDISGAGDLIKGQGNGDLTYTGTSTSSGDLTVDTGAFTLDETGSLTFEIGANGMNNQINGLSTDGINLDGSFNFDLIGASLVDGNSWSIVSASNVTYGATFSVVGFTEDADVWSNGSGFTFSEASGDLTYAIPEPSSAAFLLGAGILGFLSTSRRRRAAN